jgi:mono/diheme cytochrome c family protein
VRHPVIKTVCELLGIGLMIAGAYAVAQETDNITRLHGDAEAGRRFYQQFGCYACHGHTGETGSGTRLNPPRHDQATFIAYVRNPSGSMVGTGPSATMPAYGGAVVTDQTLADIHAWLSSIPAGSPPLESIPLLNR